ncbi:hypothetical protein [Pseudonocardia oroxyli]|uniref:DUF8083 domain-containing protein n=1 Tax=Pseudonocardia oroxyli TaxID=366584 RepID=A0A1G7UI59_PSEOR|nr:hypothetical protein [Pseudonocardia oroxyli]SDG47242.1 hypothetical protein SAMN05216377_11256 [Pseudonocardia oroxyli]
MPSPFVSYLRVYEPLRAFEGPAGAAVRAGLARGAVRPDRVGRRERELCLRATVRGRLLPGDLGAADAPVDVLVLGGEGGEPYVCPLDTRPRAAAAVLGFLAEEDPLLRAAALVVPEASARRRAERAVAELGEAAAHVVTAGWTVPLPWFALVDPEERQVKLGAQRRIWWRVPIEKALSRAAHAERVVRGALGDGGAAEVLAETRGWLGRFDRNSIVELDYGGLVELLDDATIEADDSASRVQRALRLLRAGDTDGAAENYAALREFWGAVAARRQEG